MYRVKDVYGANGQVEVEFADEIAVRIAPWFVGCDEATTASLVILSEWDGRENIDDIESALGIDIRYIAGVKTELVGAAEQGELHEVDHRELIARWRE